MSVATSAQSFTTSGSFWTLLTALLGNILSLVGAFTSVITPQVTVLIMGVWNSLGFVIAGYFRMRADQPLTFALGAPALPPAPPQLVERNTEANIAIAAQV